MKARLLLTLLSAGLLLQLVPFSIAAGDSGGASQVPHLLRFEGVLKDASGTPLAGLQKVTFSIYEEEVGGAPLWEEIHDLQLDGDGRYSVLLGQKHPEGLPVRIFAGGQARWLAIRAHGPAVPERPRILLVSVPYALKAEEAERLAGKSLQDFVLVEQLKSPEERTRLGLEPSTTAATVFSKVESPNQYPAQSSTACDPALGYACLNSTNIFQSSPLGTEVTQVLHSVDSATPASGFPSNSLEFRASAYNSSQSAPESQRFLWQAEPLGNNSSSPSARLNLLFAKGTGSPAPTGLSFLPDGTINFVPQQTFNISTGLNISGNSFFASPVDVTSDSATTPPLTLRGAPNHLSPFLNILRNDGLSIFDVRSDRIVFQNGSVAERSALRLYDHSVQPSRTLHLGFYNYGAMIATDPSTAILEFFIGNGTIGSTLSVRSIDGTAGSSIAARDAADVHDIRLDFSVPNLPQIRTTGVAALDMALQTNGGASTVRVNSLPGGGTGGLEVWSGGANPVKTLHLGAAGERISFGSSGDASLYRAALNTLRTDGSLVLTGPRLELAPNTFLGTQGPHSSWQRSSIFTAAFDENRLYIVGGNSSNSTSRRVVRMLDNVEITGKISVGAGVASNSGGFKHVRVPTGAIQRLQDVAVSITWVTPFQDANYTVNCSVLRPTVSRTSLRVLGIESIANTGIVVRVINDHPTAVQSGTLHCIAIHD